MNRLILFFLIVITKISAYSDPEIEDLLQSISNLSDPCLEDYRLIEHYFQFGDRPYLEQMTKRRDLDYRIQQLRNFKLVGSNGEMPILELYANDVTEDTKDRCILIYGSYNSNYPEKALRLLEELKKCGYSGYVMLRIGGAPDISHGGARLCAIPYTWRVNFFKEALRKGFTKILYMDSTYLPMCDFSTVFDVIDNYGLFSYTGNADVTAACRIDYIQHYSGYAKHLGIPFEQIDQIPWFDGHIVGLNFTNEKICQLFQKWYDEMHQLEGFCTIGDDIPFAFLAWSLGFQPYFVWETEVLGKIVRDCRF